MRLTFVLVLLVALVGAAWWGVTYLFDPTLAELRDVVIIIYGVVGILLLAIMIVVAVSLLVAVKALTSSVQRLIEDPIRPTLNEVRGAVQNIRGTTEFVADSAVHPVIRATAALKGVKAGLGVAAGIAKRRVGK